MSQQGVYFNSNILNAVNTLTGNVGGPIPALAHNINVVGAGLVTVTGAGNTLTISFAGGGFLSAARSDLGVGFDAVPDLGIINFLGGTNVNTSSPGGAPGNTLTINLNDNVDLAGYLEAATTIGTINGELYAGNNGNNQVPAQISMYKSRAGGAVTIADQLGYIRFFGNDGTSNIVGASILARTWAAGTIAPTQMPTDIEIYTHDDAPGLATKRMTIAHDGSIYFHAYTNGIILSDGTGFLDSLDSGPIGTVLTSTGGPGTAPTWQPNSPGGVTWHIIAINQIAAENEGYVCNGAGTIEVRLPAVFAAEKVVRVAGMNNATGFRIVQQAGQVIHWDDTHSTTVGLGGYIESTDTYDSVELLCTVANTEWIVISSKGNPTIV